MSIRRLLLAVLVVPVMLATGVAAAEQVGHRVVPERRDATEDRIRTLRVPDGFALGVFARDLGNPRMLGVADDGMVYVTRQQQGDVLALRDRDGDGRADERTTAIDGLARVHGITLRDRQAYLAGPTTLWVCDRRDDGTFGPARVLVADLPAGPQHLNRTLAFGPDGMLYVSIGSSCNACDEAEPENATILRVQPDGSRRTVFARGLRNTIGFGWHPQTRAMWGMDHGSDWRGDDLPPEELNQLLDGRNYGWPYVFGKRVVDPQMEKPPGMDGAKYAAQTEPSTLEYQAHSAPIGMVFYTGTQFPAEYRHDAFVAMRGSWNRQPPTGYKIVRVRFRDGIPVGFEDFVTGFLVDEGRAHFGRLAGVAVARDGALLFGDDTNGVLYRIAATGGRAAARPAP